jgi:hypothetical protein
MFVALADNSNVTPGSNVAAGIWSGIAFGSGDGPAGIPYTISVHNLTTSGTPYVTPAASGNSTNTITSTSSIITPHACTPSMTIYSFGPN